jgi:hypothetical protein
MFEYIIHSILQVYTSTQILNVIHYLKPNKYTTSTNCSQSMYKTNKLRTRMQINNLRRHVAKPSFYDTLR